MVTENFFDLQRFADDTLKGSASGFTWQNGGSFAGDDPYYYVAAGADSTALASISDTTAINFVGTTAGYSFAVSQNAANWEVAIKGASNIIGGNFSASTGAYILDGVATVTALAKSTEGFTETVNDQATHVKATGSANVPFQVAADGFTDESLEYTFNSGVANVEVGVDNDDAAIFGGSATGVVFATGESFAGKTPALNFGASVTVTASDNIVTYTTNDNRITGADNESNGAIMIMGDIAPAGPALPGYTAPTGPATITSDGNIQTGGHFIGLKTDKGFGYAGDSAFGESGITVDGKTWKQINGSLSGIVLNPGGTVAAVDNTGAVTVVGTEGSQVDFAKLTPEGVVANGATIGGVVFGEGDGEFDSFNVVLGESGIKSIGFDQEDDVVRIIGPSSTSSYEVKVAGTQYTLSANTDTLKFDAYVNAANEAWVVADNGKQYSINGAAATFYTEEVDENDTAKNTINGAQVAIINYNTGGSTFEITTNNGKAGSYNTGADGVDVISNLYMGDTVNVARDYDGYTAIWKTGTDKDIVVDMTANDINIKVNASSISAATNEPSVTLQVDSTGEKATVSGIASTVVTLNGGTAGNANVYYFNGDTVSVAEGETTHVTLDTEGKIEESRSAAAEERFAADNAKWEEYATLGSSEDTLNTDRGTTYEDFYDLAFAAGASYTIAGYDRDNYSTVTNGESNINIIGESPLGDPQPVADAIHVTLDVNSGDSVGAVPINIESDESKNVNDVTIDLTGSDRPSTIAIGTNKDSAVEAPHKVYLSNVEGSVAYIGDKATGLNLVQAGTGGAMMRHDGDAYRASIFGGAGNDTIWAAAKDIVKGGGGADVYYDRSNYTIQDYNFSEGDMIIATNVDGIDKFTRDNIRYGGNSVNFDNKTITFADREPGDNLFINVGFMDNNGNLNNTDRDVVLVNTANTVDAAGAGANAAIIIADQGTYANMIYGTNGVDTIYAGTGDSVLSGAGNDDIHISDANPGVVVGLVAGSGHDTVYNWSVWDGFNNNEWANKLYTGGNKNVNATYKEDKLVVGIGSGDSLTFANTPYYDAYNILIDDTKYTVIRKDGTADIYYNNNVADVYLGQENGGVYFHEGVTDALNIDLNNEKAQNIRKVHLHSQGKDTVRGSDARETVMAHGSETAGATKYIYMSGGNDFIDSGYDGNGYAANILMFGNGDGRDSIVGFKHYMGIDKDPDNQRSDLLVLEDLESIEVSSYTATDDIDSGDRIVFNTTANDQVVIYEEGGLAVNDNMYRVHIQNMNEEGYAKIGYSNQANTFTYDSEVSYYVGSADNIHDTLTIGEDDFNVEVWLDNTGNKFYRGIDVLDASAATDTEVSLAGNKNNNTIIAGGAGTRNSLWGGAGDNLLIGGDGEDLFAYSHKSRDYINGGNEVAEASHDTIQGYTNGVDNIYVDATLADLDLTAMSKVGVDGIADDSVTLIFSNGGSLVVQGSENTTITMSDGNAYTANRSNKQWEARG